MLKVCLVVIARDAQRTIGRLLASVSPWVQSMVVMDTGSTDSTLQIAKAHGAHVHTQAWQDDFSLARNAALSQASADWHLVLDADEWLIEGGEFLRQLAGTSPDFVGQVQIEDDCDAGDLGRTTATSWLSRLLPGNLRYEGRVHEQPVHKLPIIRTPLRIGHDGYLAAALAAKRGRNRRLLEAALRQHPGDAYLMYQLGKDANVYQEHALADQWFSCAWPRSRTVEPWRLDLIVRWIGALKHLGRHQEAHSLAVRHGAEFDHSPDFHFALGDLMLHWTGTASHRAESLLFAAEEAWRRCLIIGERPDQQGAVLGRGSRLAAFNLALVLEGTGRVNEATELRRRFGLSPGRLLP